MLDLIYNELNLIWDKYKLEEITLNTNSIIINKN